MTKLSTLLDQIDNGTILLPEFQRGYVWNRDQVRGLMRSIYRGYPVGALLVWETTADRESARGESAKVRGVRQMLLDGQQRITSLYGVIRGTRPPFFEGDVSAFTGLRFNVEDETFEFYAPAKMRDDPCWVDVSDLFIKGVDTALTPLQGHSDLTTLMMRLLRLVGIKDREFHLEQITGQDKSVEVVVDIFNKVNSGGTKLSKGDLALAKICAEVPETRERMRSILGRWRSRGFAFSLDWLLRNAAAVATGRAQFSHLDLVSSSRFETALTQAEAYVGTFLDAASGRLGLDHDRVLMGRGAIPVASRLLHRGGGRFADSTERDRVLYWYIHSALWGRYAGSTETMLAKDYEAVEESGVDGLISTLERYRGGNLTVDEQDFAGSTRGSRFYPLLYLLTRVDGARDFGTGLELKSEMLGRLCRLEVHHIFPKALLERAGYARSEINAVANFCFLTQDTNLQIGKREPGAYFVEAEERHPGALASQWIPGEPELWQVDRYRDFLTARRRLLAAAANRLLDGLRSGSTTTIARALEPVNVIAEEPDHRDARAEQLEGLVAELRSLGNAEPVRDAEISDPRSGRALAVAEAYWPDGLQPGQTAPVVLELDPAESDLARLEELGYEVFTSVDALIGFARNRSSEAAGDEPDQDAEQGEVPPSDPKLVADFNSAMTSLYYRSRSEADYTPTYFLSMLAEHGGLGTAKRLLASGSISDGFIALWERKRLDLTIEAVVVRPEFRELFTDDELAMAQSRLDQFSNGSGSAQAS